MMFRIQIMNSLRLEPVQESWCCHALAMPKFCMETHMIMPQHERLTPWAIVRLLPNMQRIVVARFRKRSDADGHWRILRQHIPKAVFIVVFDYVPTIDE